jgi:hypothetical protein
MEWTSAVQIGRTVVSFTVRNTAVDKNGGNNMMGVAMMDQEGKGGLGKMIGGA